MLRLGGLAKGDMQQCLAELQDSSLPEDFKLRQVRSLLRFVREVGDLVDHIKNDSGFAADTTSYLEILCSKEEADLIRRVSHTRVLRQDFDEKRIEWRKQKKSVIGAIANMTSRALRFEDKERKTIALYALEYYKNVMGTDEGAILGESESTSALVEQYRRHRREISKIPMYADSIVRMLKDIRKTVRASAKLNPGSNAFAQFLDEWWSSVVAFLQRSSIVDAEANAREAMQTLKKLKGKQEESKKREISRLLSKLEDHASKPLVGRLSELFAHRPSAPEVSTSPEALGRWNSMREALSQQGISEDRDSTSNHSSEESELMTSPTVEGDDVTRSPEDLILGSKQHRKERPHQLSLADANCQTFTSTAMSGTGALRRSNSTPGIECKRPSLTVSVGSEDVHSRPVTSVRSPPSLRPTSSIPAVQPDPRAPASRVSWDEGSVGTAGTSEVPVFSGIPESDDDDEDEDGDGDDDLFEAANDTDLDAVDLCARSGGTDGQTTYQDQEELCLPASVSGVEVPGKANVEKERFSAALDFFRHEQHRRYRRTVMPPRPPSPAVMRPASFNKLITPRGSARSTNALSARKTSGGFRDVKGKTSSGISKQGGVKLVRRVSAERPGTTTRAAILAGSSGKGKGIARSMSVYIPRAQKATTPLHRASKTPTVRSSRRVLASDGLPSSRAAPRGVFFA